MKKHIAWAAGLLLFVPGLVLAAEFRTGDQPSISANERIQNDVYIAGGSVTSAGAVVGDLIAGGGNVVVSGEVSADVIVGGGNVTILSNVGDDVRAGGGNVVVMGRVAGDLIIGGGQISVGGPGVGGDVAVGAGTVRIDAPVGGSVKIGGGTVYLNAPIQGKVELDAESITLGPNAVIQGELVYTSAKELTQEAGAVVRGKVTFNPREEGTSPEMALTALISLWVLGKFLALLAAAMILGLLFKRYAREVAEQAHARPFFELGRGFLFMVATPILAVILCVTVIGIPLGILGFLSFAAAVLFAWIVAPIILGSYLYGYFSRRGVEVSWKTIILGVVVYEILGLIPFIGWLAQIIIMFISLGVVVGLKLKIAAQWR